MPDKYHPKISAWISDEEYLGLQKMVDAGDFPTTSEAIREAVRNMIDKKTRKLKAEMSLYEKYGKI